jgi:hypothetical protein
MMTLPILICKFYVILPHLFVYFHIYIYMCVCVCVCVCVNSVFLFYIQYITVFQCCNLHAYVATHYFYATHCVLLV